MVTKTKENSMNRDLMDRDKSRNKSKGKFTNVECYHCGKKKGMSRNATES